jgi:hypothetical protein
MEIKESKIVENPNFLVLIKDLLKLQNQLEELQHALQGTNDEMASLEF